MQDSNNEVNDDLKEIEFLNEEGHYYHTLVDFVDLLVTYGYVKVLKDVFNMIEGQNK